MCSFWRESRRKRKILSLPRPSRFVRDMFPTLKLLLSILSISSSKLFNLVQSHCGRELLDVFIVIQALFDGDEYDPPLNLTSSSNCLPILFELLDRFPHLSAVIEPYKNISRVADQNDHSSLISILNTICANLNRPKRTVAARATLHTSRSQCLSMLVKMPYRLVALNVPQPTSINHNGSKNAG